jgi:hypothetical protein
MCRTAYELNNGAALELHWFVVPETLWKPFAPLHGMLPSAHVTAGHQQIR